MYNFKCNVGNCGKPYIGETHQTLATRVQQHRDDAKHKKAGTPWGEPFLRYHPSDAVANDSFFCGTKVLATEPDRARRKLHEAVKIRDDAPAVNISAGWSLL